MAKDFKKGDTVWAKMKGYPFWPGIITDPLKEMKTPSKDNFRCVYFFGTKNYSWIDITNLKDYASNKVEFGNSSKTSLKLAVDDIEEFLKRGDPKLFTKEDTFDQLVSVPKTPKRGVKRKSSDGNADEGLPLPKKVKKEIKDITVKESMETKKKKEKQNKIMKAKQLKKNQETVEEKKKEIKDVKKKEETKDVKKKKEEIKQVTKNEETNYIKKKKNAKEKKGKETKIVKEGNQLKEKNKKQVKKKETKEKDLKEKDKKETKGKEKKKLKKREKKEVKEKEKKVTKGKDKKKIKEKKKKITKGKDKKETKKIKGGKETKRLKRKRDKKDVKKRKQRKEKVKKLSGRLSRHKVARLKKKIKKREVLRRSISPSPNISIRNTYSYLSRPSSSKTEVEPLDLSKCSEDLIKKKIKPSSLVFGFIGLGVKGSRILKNIVHSKHNVLIWNRTPKKCEQFENIGVKVANTPYDVGSTADIIFLCVGSNEASIVDLLFGSNLSLAIKPGGKSFVNLSNISDEISTHITDFMEAFQCRYLEVRTMGTIQEADKGLLNVFAAGDRSLFDDCESCLMSFSEDFNYLGASIKELNGLHYIQNAMTRIASKSLTQSLRLVKRSGNSVSQFFGSLLISYFQDEAFVTKFMSDAREGVSFDDVKETEWFNSAMRNLTFNFGQNISFHMAGFDPSF